MESKNEFEGIHKLGLKQYLNFKGTNSLKITS